MLIRGFDITFNIYNSDFFSLQSMIVVYCLLGHAHLMLFQT